MSVGNASSAPRLVCATTAEVFGTIAHLMVAEGRISQRIGSVTLLPHQREGAERVWRLVERHGGALLCDAVGVGKTYVALAVAERVARAIVVAPAVLRDMWTRAIAAAGVRADVVSVESLGRGRVDRSGAPLVIVDEAHHLRNPATRRYDAAARLCASARTLLLTATPLHNTRRDLAALVALFAGVRAHAWTDEELARVVVRRDRSVVAGQPIPRVEHAPPCRLTQGDEGVLDELLTLPPSVPPADGGDAGPLVAHSLVRQWASSGAALSAALRRRIARGRALLAALDDGRYPTRAELREWICTEDSVQLAFTRLLVTSPAADPALRAALERHVSALVALLQRVDADTRADRERADRVRDICARHAPARVVAFTCYEETADMLYRALRHDARAALLTARGGLVAGGRLSRAEVLERFAPDASGRRRVAEHERIELLIATDLLSEGVNLQDASVVIHVDLPWTGARLAQRVGRIARVGSRHSAVTAYAFRPSARAEAIVRAAQIVQRKAALASNMLGASADGADGSLPAPVPPDRSRTPVECAEEMQRLLRSFLPADPPDSATTLVAHVAAATERALVACVVDGAPQLVAVDRESVQTSPALVLATIETALAAETVRAARAVPDDTAAAERVVRIVQEWHARRSAASDAGVELPVGERRVRAVMRARRRSISRLDGAVSASSFAQRDAAAARAATLRALAGESAPIGAERILYDAEAYNAGNAVIPQRSHEATAASSALRIVALLLLRPAG